MAHTHPRQRRGLCGNVLIPAAALVFACGRGGCQIVVVTNAGVPAYRTAAAGLLETVRPAAVIDLAEWEDVSRAAAEIDKARPVLVVAIGSQATAAAGAAAAPVLATMILHSESVAAPRRSAGAVTLEVPLAAVLAEARRIFPRAARAGFIRNAARPEPLAAQFEAEARNAGFTCAIAACSGPETLLAALASLQGRVDFVWCPPDGTLFNSTTVQPLVLASLRQRLPLLGFSENFVRAGAAAGVFPDFRAVGLQTGELALRWLRLRPPAAAVEPTRGWRTAVNKRIFRLLGLELPEQPDWVVIR